MTADRPGVDVPVAGVCCRCRVRHDDELCCACGVVHRGYEAGVGDVLLVSCTAIGLGVVLAVCAKLGTSASDGTKLLVAIPLALAPLVVLRWVVKLDDEQLDTPPWVGPGSFRDTEPKEQ